MTGDELYDHLLGMVDRGRLVVVIPLADWRVAWASCHLDSMGVLYAACPDHGVRAALAVKAASELHELVAAS